jgi:MFS family permease
MNDLPASMTPASTREFISVEWRFLLFGMAMAFCSSLGQTFFISLFSGHIRAELSLSHGEFGTYYAIATTCSAISLLWVGKLADVMRVEKLALIVLSALCIAAMLFSQVFSVLTLICGLYMLRLCGQGMMTHVYSTAMARRYVAARGRALSIAQMGINVAESIGPISVVALLTLIDWRQVWLVLPIGLALALAPNIRYLTQRTRFQDGGGLEALQEKAEKQAATTDTAETADTTSASIVMIDGIAHWRRQAMLRDRRFWFGLIGLFTVPNFTITGLLFHQIHLAELKDVSLESWTTYYVLYAGFAILGTLASGQLVDRFTARRVAAHTMLPTTIACTSLWLGDSSFGVPMFFALFGLAAGMPFSALTAIIAELYGTRYLGEIRSVFLPVGVFASALSPMVMGLLIDNGYGMPALMGLNIVLALVAQISALVFLRLAAPPISQ